MAFPCRFYSSPYSIATNRIIGPTSLAPYMHSPVSAYQVTSFSGPKMSGCSLNPRATSQTVSDQLTSVTVIPAGTPVVVASSIVHHAAHSEYLLELFPYPSAILTPSLLSSLPPFLSLSRQGAVLTSGMDHSMSIHPTSMIGPLTQQLNHLSIGSSGTVSRTSSTLRPCCAICT